jgi:hypothetical protein
METHWPVIVLARLGLKVGLELRALMLVEASLLGA